jgi:DNA-binding transcriptional ArsR family regulator
MDDREMASVAGEYPAADISAVALVEVMKALADPVRLQIMRVLASGEPLNKSTTDWGCDLSRATMSHHFRILREAGLTLTFVEGRAHRVQLRRTEFDARFPGLLNALAASPPPAGR